jgi:hypothetical protein
MIAVKIGKQVEPILTDEQKGCRADVRGTTHQLLIDRVITEQVVLDEANMAVAWLDVAKAFDTVNHDWILSILKAYKIDDKLIRLVGNLMSEWKVKLTIKGKIISSEIKIQQGIFQGDSLSPLLFIIALNPISAEIAKLDEGLPIPSYTKPRINHLLYVDDWKVYGETSKEVNTLCEKIDEWTKAAGLQLNKKKCSFMAVKDGKIQTERITEATKHLSEFDAIKESADTHKYLGMKQNITNKEELIQKETEADLLGRVAIVSKLQTSAKTITALINTWALGKLRYTMALLDWKDSRLEQIDRKIRKILSTNGYRHGKGGINALYIPRALGGRGLTSSTDLKKLTVVSINQYLSNELKWLTEAFPENETIQRIQTLAKETMSTLGLAEGEITKVKEKLVQQRIEALKTSALQGKFEHTMDKEKDKVAVEASRNWMAKENLHPAHEKLIFGIRDQTIPTRAIRTRIWKQEGPSTCRICGKAEETIDHLTSECGELGFTEYIARHNNVATVILAAILRAHNVNFESRWWNHRPPGVIQLDGSKQHFVQWEPRFPTVNHLEHCKPDLYVQLPSGKKLIIEVTVCRDDKACTRAEEKAQRYHALAQDIALQTKKYPLVLPIAIGVTGVVSKMTERAVKKLNELGIPLKLSKLQKAAAIGSSKILSKIVNQ